MKLHISFHSQKGTTITIFALFLVMLLGLTAFVTDVGTMVVDKSRLSNTIDAAALAGAQELASGSSQIYSVVNEYISKNLDGVSDIKISWNNSDRSVEVSGSKKVSSFFSKVISTGSGKLNASAEAKVEIIRSMKGIRPLAVVAQDFVYGRQYILKEGGGGGSAGNFGVLALGGNGAANYKENLLNGYPYTITVGDLIETEPGNMSGSTQTAINHLVHSCPHTPQCTYDNYNPNCPRIIFLPVVDTLDVNGRKCVRVLGFATFFLEGVTNNCGNADVTGRFITYNTQGEAAGGIDNFGTCGIRLVK